MTQTTSSTNEIEWTRPAHTSAGKYLPEGAYYDEDAADRAVQFFGLLKLVEGRGAGERWDLMPWMEYEVIRPLFGYKRADGTRLYRTVWLEVPRKNAKTTLAAGLALYGLVADGEPGAQVYMGARDRHQARICFELARKMVQASPSLRKRCRAVRSYIEVPDTGSVLRTISGEALGQHGFNAHIAVLDEVHAHKNRDIWDVMASSVGARRQPIVIGITTAGTYDVNHIAWEQHDYAVRVASNELDDPSYLAVIYGVEPEDDWTEPKIWKKANPSMGVTIMPEFFEDEIRKAKVSPARQTSFEQLYLNKWTREVSRWINMDSWSTCGEKPIDIEAYKGRACFVGLDLSSTTDISALVQIFPEEDGSFTVYPRFWIPTDNLADRERRDRLPYGQWAASGHLNMTPGNVIDYRFIKHEIEQMATDFHILELAYDPWNSTQLVVELAEQGLRVAPTRQGFATMSAPTKELERLIVSGQLSHGNHPVLASHADAALVSTDPAGNLKPDKAKSTARIDGLVALIMALNSAMLAGTSLTGKSVYEERGVELL
jgi:phage terminase large subunit-like protein